MNAKTQNALRKLIADSTTAPILRRAATLRLARLRAATTAPTTRSAVTTRTNAPEAAPSEQSKFEAYQAFIALSKQRSALFNKRRTTAEREIFKAMLALMPATEPQGNDPTAWRNFVAQIDGLLSEIKNVPNL